MVEWVASVSHEVCGLCFSFAPSESASAWPSMSGRPWRSMGDRIRTRKFALPPARAGSACECSRQGQPSQVYPRACGGTTGCPAGPRLSGVYPRVGGGTKYPRIPFPPIPGLSPRGRGLLMIRVATATMPVAADAAVPIAVNCVKLFCLRSQPCILASALLNRRIMPGRGHLELCFAGLPGVGGGGYGSRRGDRGLLRGLGGPMTIV